MIPKRIVLENFLSFGPETEIAFADDEPLWVLGGPNGVGKSAVFDAMTYALYGQHRGGATDHASLVRHGANGFRVVFEFEFNGTAYRITRNRPAKGGPTNDIKQWSDGGWNRTVSLPRATGRHDPVKVWAERTLGLDFDAFAASVLLRQGEADKIITATGSERLTILKKIIGAERYEALSDRVHAAARRCKDRLEDLRTRRDGMTPVTEDEVQAARDDLARREEERSRARAAVDEAVERVPLAKRWVQLVRDAEALDREIRDADARATDADRIRRDHARLNDLSAVIPMLRQAVTLRGRVCEAAEASSKLHDDEKALAGEMDRLTAAVDQEKQKAEGHHGRADAETAAAKLLREAVGRKEKQIPAATEVAKLEADLLTFHPQLSSLLDAARVEAGHAAETLARAGEARAAAARLLAKAEEQQRRFDTVGVGVKCSLCGQQVSEEHAADECARLADEVRELKTERDRLAAAERTAAEGKKAAEGERDRLEDLQRQRTDKSQRLADLRRTLNEMGVTADAEKLRSEVTADKEAAVGHERKARAEDEGRRFAEAEAARLGKARQEAADRLFAALEGERRLLEESGVAEQYRRLEQDAARREGCVQQLAEVNRQIEETPAAGRVPVETAERQLQETRRAAKVADDAWDAARKKADVLAVAAERFRELVDAIAAAEKKSDLHRKLDDLLGKGGLQRELVRMAEREIVRLANDTVQNLSDGDLAVELDDGADGADEAFALRVRSADGPTPIGVAYLSGSQKFRVAVSVALAIGRYAAGQSRRLESVIIDEGFGSLDRDGLRAAADELNRLRQYLRRIIVVSHQEEFAGRFPALIRLAPGENGATAVAVRQ